MTDAIPLQGMVEQSSVDDCTEQLAACVYTGVPRGGGLGGFYPTIEGSEFFF